MGPAHPGSPESPRPPAVALGCLRARRSAALGCLRPLGSGSALGSVRGSCGAGISPQLPGPAPARPAPMQAIKCVVVGDG